MTAPAIPFVTDVKATALVGAGLRAGLVLTYFDENGRTIARTVSTPEEVDALGRNLLAVAAAARAADPKLTPIGRSPTARSRLMRQLRVADPGGAVLDLAPAPFGGDVA